MANFNKVMLIGNLTRDPELRYTQSGSALVNFGLAVNRRYRNRNTNEMVEETTFVDIEGWGAAAETFNQYMRKGRPVFVEGRLRLDTWEGKDGSKRSKLVVVMENFQFLGQGSEGGGGGGGGYSGGGGARRQPARANTGGAGNSRQSGGGSGDAVDPPGEDLNFDDIPF